jgi:hypothetical protein
MHAREGGKGEGFGPWGSVGGGPATPKGQNKKTKIYIFYYYYLFKKC